jgi:uncharacterized membrane protein
MTHHSQEHAVVAIYDSHLTAEAALKTLQAGGIDMKRLSIIGKDFQTEEHALGFYSAGDRMQTWGGRGALWGSAWGLLFGSAFFFIPAIGPLVVMGPLAGWLVGALEGAAVGGATGVLAAALTNIGLPKDSVVKYELEVKAGKFLVIVRGSAELVERARHLLAKSGASQLTAHQAYEQRDAVMKLLSDEEVATVSIAETAPRLAEGDEYLDLEQLELGVRSARGGAAVATPMGHVLPRKAVNPDTWSRILSQLKQAPAATTTRAS